MMMAFTFTDGLLLSMLSIFFVIALIFVIVIAITPLKRLSPQTKEAIYEKEPLIQTNTIKDEDMMVAVLVASIDFRESTKKEPYLKSVRESEQ